MTLCSSKTIKWIVSLFSFWILVSSATARPSFPADTVSSSRPDSLNSHRSAYLYLRGLAQEHRPARTPWTVVRNTLGFVPSQIAQGLRFASGYGARLINDPTFIDTVDDFFFTEDHVWGWYPIVNIASGFRPEIGGNLMFQKDRKQMVIRGQITNRKKYRIDFSWSYQWATDPGRWRITLQALEAFDDDLEFYGFGSTPREDLRNRIRENTEREYGVYERHQHEFQFTTFFRPLESATFGITTGYRTCILHDSRNSEKSVFSLFTAPDLTHTLSSQERISARITARLDSHDPDLYLTTGVRTHISMGWRWTPQYVPVSRSTEFKITASLPVLLGNRLLKPRLIYRQVTPLPDGGSLALFDYPAHPEFRGVSDRIRLRTDHHLVITSLEYQWPLSFNLGGHFFIDVLTVSEHLKTLALETSPWAVGLGVDFHMIDGELARVQAAAGSEGIRMSLDIGFSL
jgi:hypothetical protein